MFMIATIQKTVAGTPTQLGSDWIPTTGNVKRSTQTPKETTVTAAPTWPPSFCHQTRPRASSSAPTIVAMAAPRRMPRTGRVMSSKAMSGTKMPKKSAEPAEARDRQDVEAALLPRLVDRADAPREAADGRRQDEHDEQREPAGVEDPGGDDEVGGCGEHVHHFVP